MRPPISRGPNGTDIATRSLPVKDFKDDDEFEQVKLPKSLALICQLIILSVYSSWTMIKIQNLTRLSTKSWLTTTWSRGTFLYGYPLSNNCNWGIDLQPDEGWVRWLWVVAIMPINLPVCAWLTLISLGGLAPNFWQYAIIKQQVIDTGKLTYVTTYEVICSAIPIADKLTPELYSNGQKKSSKFAQTLQEISSAGSTCVGKFDWQAEFDEYNAGA